MNTSINQRIVWQLLIWFSLFIGLPFLFFGSDIENKFWYRSVGMFIGALVFLPLNLKILFPNYYASKQVSKYILSCILSLAVIAALLVLVQLFIKIPNIIPHNLNRQSNVPKYVFHFLRYFFPLIPLFLSSALYEIFIVANQSARETAQLKSEKLESELKFLKSQINPHFLFNSLNNIYTLTVLNPNAAGESLLKLSEMLRYLLYECDVDKVSLGRELTYLQNYIDLFSLKDESDLNIQFDATDVNKSVMIAPLLFIPFIENAFKHSQVEDLEHGWISAILFGDGQQVYFEVKNSLPKTAFSKDSVGGIGLQNVKRQLELVYPEKHTLKINKTSDSFSVELTIVL